MARFPLRMHLVAWPCKSALGNGSLCKSIDNNCHLVACTQKLAQLSVLIAQAKTGLIPHILYPHHACETLQEAVCAFSVPGCFPAEHSCTHTHTPKLPYATFQT